MAIVVLQNKMTEQRDGKSVVKKPENYRRYEVVDDMRNVLGAIHVRKDVNLTLGDRLILTVA